MARNTRRIWAIVLAILLASQAFALAEQGAGSGKIHLPTGDMAVRTPSQPMEMLSTADIDNLNAQMAGYSGRQQDLLRNRAESYFYYDNLDPLSKEIYDVMFTVAQDPVSLGNIGLMMTVVDPQSDEFYLAFNVAYRAICFDHPELFWLYAGQEASLCYGSEAISQNGFYFVYIMMVEPFTQFEAQMTAFNRAVDEFLSGIDTGISEYETVRQIHDKLIALVDYDDPVAEHSIRLSKGQDLAHTAYGALVADTAGVSNAAVCDGYALAFEYLLQQCGIDSVFLGGMAGSSEADAGGHAWNMVKVDGVWYEADSTWDDWGNLEGDLLADPSGYEYLWEALQDPQYREKIDHYLFLVSTEEMRHFVPGTDYDYISRDRTMICTLAQESVHIRMTSDSDPMNPDPQVIKLAPVAMQSYPWGP